MGLLRSLYIRIGNPSTKYTEESLMIMHQFVSTIPFFLVAHHKRTNYYHYWLLLLLLIYQSPGLPGWRKVNLITVTRRPLQPSIAAGLYCLTTSPGFLTALCEKWSGFFYVHRVWLSYTRDRRLKVSSERLGNEDKAPCPRALLPGRGSNRGPPVWKSEVLTARPRQLLIKTIIKFEDSYLDPWSSHLLLQAWYHERADLLEE